MRACRSTSPPRRRRPAAGEEFAAAFAVAAAQAVSQAPPEQERAIVARAFATIAAAAPEGSPLALAAAAAAAAGATQKAATNASEFEVRVEARRFEKNPATGDKIPGSETPWELCQGPQMGNNSFPSTPEAQIRRGDVYDHIAGLKFPPRIKTVPAPEAPTRVVVSNRMPGNLETDFAAAAAIASDTTTDDDDDDDGCDDDDYVIETSDSSTGETNGFWLGAEWHRHKTMEDLVDEAVLYMKAKWVQEACDMGLYEDCAGTLLDDRRVGAPECRVGC